MTGSGDTAATPAPAVAADEHHDSAADAALPPVAQESDGPMDATEFAARLDVDPERDDVKG